MKKNKTLIAGILLACMAALGSINAQNNTPIVGDVDGDGYLTGLDVGLIRQYVLEGARLSPEMFRRANMDGDDEVNTMDILRLNQIVRKKASRAEKPGLKVSIEKVPDFEVELGSVESYGAVLVWSNDSPDPIGIVSVGGLNVSIDGNYFASLIQKVRLYDGYNSTTPLNTGAHVSGPTPEGSLVVSLDKALVVPPVGTAGKTTVLRQNIAGTVARGHTGNISWSIGTGANIQAFNMRTGERVEVNIVYPNVGPKIHVVFSKSVRVVDPTSPATIRAGEVSEFGSFWLENGMEPIEGGFIEFSVESETDISPIEEEMALSVGNKIFKGTFVVLDNAWDHIGTVIFDLSEMKQSAYHGERVILLGMVSANAPQGLKLSMNKERVRFVGFSKKYLEIKGNFDRIGTVEVR